MLTVLASARIALRKSLAVAFPMLAFSCSSWKAQALEEMIDGIATVVNASIWYRPDGPVGDADRKPVGAKPLTLLESSDYNRNDGDPGEQILRRTDLELSSYLPYLINRLGVAMVERFERDGLRATRLTIGTWRVLAATASHRGVRQVDLARMTSIEVSTVSRLVTRLVQLGLVARSRSTRSNREVIVRLTPKGRRLFAGLVPVAGELQKAATRGVTKAELAMVKRVLSRMHENLQPA